MCSFLNLESVPLNHVGKRGPETLQYSCAFEITNYYRTKSISKWLFYKQIICSLQETTIWGSKQGFLKFAEEKCLSVEKHNGA